MTKIEKLQAVESHYGWEARAASAQAVVESHNTLVSKLNELIDAVNELIEKSDSPK